MLPVSPYIFHSPNISLLTLEWSILLTLKQQALAQLFATNVKLTTKLKGKSCYCNTKKDLPKYIQTKKMTLFTRKPFIFCTSLPWQLGWLQEKWILVGAYLWLSLDLLSGISRTDMCCIYSCDVCFNEPNLWQCFYCTLSKYVW